MFNLYLKPKEKAPFTQFKTSLSIHFKRLLENNEKAKKNR